MKTSLSDKRRSYRIDGDEIYSIQGKYLGFIDDGFTGSPSGDLLFTIEPE
jgi:hypothetical protein